MPEGQFRCTWRLGRRTFKDRRWGRRHRLSTACERRRFRCLLCPLKFCNKVSWKKKMQTPESGPFVVEKFMLPLGQWLHFYLWHIFPHLSFKSSHILKTSYFSPRVTVHPSRYCFIIMCFERLEERSVQKLEVMSCLDRKTKLNIIFSGSSVASKEEWVECPCKISSTFLAGFHEKMWYLSQTKNISLFTQANVSPTWINWTWRHGMKVSFALQYASTITVSPFSRHLTWGTVFEPFTSVTFSLPLLFNSSPLCQY